ncbi:MAG: hypothetical protein EOO73_18400 [Myxococcales bacterium]|nr:MAG: hypothetical protein EOO73_18400 [Myxococcales bacterium]
MSAEVRPTTRWPWLARYLAELTTPRQVLWCYLIWWSFVLIRYFDPSLSLWLSSLGISVIIGTGLYLSTAYGGRTRTALEPWQIARLYMMPFCVSSFAALIKGHGFLLVFDPSPGANVSALLACGALVGGAALARRARAAG